MIIVSLATISIDLIHVAKQLQGPWYGENGSV